MPDRHARASARSNRTGGGFGLNPDETGPSPPNPVAAQQLHGSSPTRRQPPPLRGGRPISNVPFVKPRTGGYWRVVDDWTGSGVVKTELCTVRAAALTDTGPGRALVIDLGGGRPHAGPRCQASRQYGGSGLAGMDLLRRITAVDIALPVALDRLTESATIATDDDRAEADRVRRKAVHALGEYGRSRSRWTGRRAPRCHRTASASPPPGGPSTRQSRTPSRTARRSSRSRARRTRSNSGSGSGRPSRGRTA